MKQAATDSLKKAKYKRKYGNQFSKHWTDDKIEETADQMIDWFNNSKNNVWLKDFAIDNMISRQRISELVKKNEYFAYIYELCLDKQESRLVKLGFDKRINVAMPIMTLKHKHNWKDENSEIVLPEKIVIKLPDNWK